jgi:hypothetical protein
MVHATQPKPQRLQSKRLRRRQLRQLRLYRWLRRLQRALLLPKRILARPLWAGSGWAQAKQRKQV